VNIPATSTAKSSRYPQSPPPFRDFVDGQDLSHINRDLSKVIILDTNFDCVSLQPENAIVLPKWKGDADDKGLIALLPFLECTPLSILGT
jgi:hypothetical protein